MADLPHISLDIPLRGGMQYRVVVDDDERVYVELYNFAAYRVRLELLDQKAGDDLTDVIEAAQEKLERILVRRRKAAKKEKLRSRRNVDAD